MMQMHIIRHRKAREVIDGQLFIDGSRICPGCLKHSKDAFYSIYDRLRKAIGRGHEITRTIEELR